MAYTCFKNISEETLPEALAKLEARINLPDAMADLEAKINLPGELAGLEAKINASVDGAGYLIGKNQIFFWQCRKLYSK